MKDRIQDFIETLASTVEEADAIVELAPESLRTQELMSLRRTVDKLIASLQEWIENYEEKKREWKLVKLRTSLPEDILWESVPNLKVTKDYFLGIDTVYLVNTNSVTNLCEAAGSYELIPVYANLIVHENMPDEDYDRERESENWIDLEMDSVRTEEAMYIHCSDFDAKIKNGSMQIMDCKLDLSNAEDENEEVEMLVEFYRGNQQL